MGGASRFIMLLTTPIPTLFHRHPSSLIFLRRLSAIITPCHFTLSYPHHHRRRRTIIKSSSHQQLHIQPLNETAAASPSGGPHPWPEWSHLINMLLSEGQGQQSAAAQDYRLSPEDGFVVYEEKELSDEFCRGASACLAFARGRPELLGMLSRRDIEVIVSNGTPFLFKTALDTARRMRVYLGIDGSNVPESKKVNTVDIMKYIISYASSPSGASSRNSLYNRELVESSVRNLLRQMTEVSYGNLALNLHASEQYQFSGGYDQTLRPVRQNVQMKRGDWICPKCSFMNFARNIKCLECEESRPKRQLIGGEWECPQCAFFNYGRNLVCLRCDCKRPGEVAANNLNSMSELGYSGRYIDKTNTDSRLLENEEKAQRWFNKVSQLNNASDLGTAAADEDFPEIMPLRKGENRFVVSTRKTPLERRLASSQNPRNSDNYGTFESNASRHAGTNKTLDSSINQSLDQILGLSNPNSETDHRGIAAEQNAQIDSSASLPRSSPSEINSSSYVPFVPLPADMFSKQNKNLKTEVGKNALEESRDSVSSGANLQSGSATLNSDSGKSREMFSGKPESQADHEKNEKEQAEKSERWFQRVAELHNVKDLPSAISDEDFPEIMPMRKGENRFVVSKKKDRSLTSPAYKRQVAMEQASNSDFVPFVPFPPGYFARKDSQAPADMDSSIKPSGETSSSSKIVESFPEKLVNVTPGPVKSDAIRETGNQARSSGDQSPRFSEKYWAPADEKASQNSSTSQRIRNDIQSNADSREGTTFQNSSASQRINDIQSNGNSREGTTSQSMNLAVSSSQMPENISSSWTGKSLEGSAVKEPDPLDMSEEAKAERWFRRVAQIKDISELSQIPDEDFPSIMPMRKGVNRFVVSKRKTPLERRLTSPQYRRNLPTVNTDTVKKESDNS